MASKCWTPVTSHRRVWQLLPLLFLFSIERSTLVVGQSDYSQPSITVIGGAPTYSSQEASALALTRELLVEVHCFWSNYGPDSENGGFYATLDREGNSIAPKAKGVVQQARHLYFFSAHYLALDDPRTAPLVFNDRGAASTGSTTCGEPPTDSASTAPPPAPDAAAVAEQQALDKRLADQAHSFLMSYMRDGDTGLFYTLVTPDGADVVDAGPLLNGNLMAIYALAVYARAFNYSVALDEALGAFRALDARMYDPQYGGYNELASVPPWGPNPKTLNGLTALTQAVMELARVAPWDDVVSERLRECLALFANKVVVQPEGYALQQFNADWSPAAGTEGGEGGSASDQVSYGMQLAASWMLLEAIPVAYGSSSGGGGGAGDGDQAGEVRAAALQLGATAVQGGYHYGHGGFFLSGAWNVSSDKVWDKVWWVQAESLPALWQLYESGLRSAGPYGPGQGAGGSGGAAVDGGAADYLGYLYDTLTWIRNCQSDKTYGEWYWLTYGDCSVAESYESGGYTYNGTVKANIWKASYHDGRALISLVRYIVEGSPGPSVAAPTVTGDYGTGGRDNGDGGK